MEILISCVVGIFIGYVPTFITEYRSLTRNAKYLAIRVICILDDYVEHCLLVVNDDGTIQGMPAREEYHEPQQPEPNAPIFPSDIDWKCIDHQIAYRILNLPNEASIAKRMIQEAGNKATSPDYEELFEERQFQYARLGLDAIGITDELRKAYALPKATNKKVKDYLIEIEQKLRGDRNF